MPADPQYDAPTAYNTLTTPHYGCHNRPRPDPNKPVVSKHVSWPYRFSTECRYDMSQTDARCSGCVHQHENASWHKELT